ncbi:hypothetical protein [Haliangium ochraceum]|nr:hypothetical protein [Haliangium ochraceum]
METATVAILSLGCRCGSSAPEVSQTATADAPDLFELYCGIEAGTVEMDIPDPEPEIVWDSPYPRPTTENQPKAELQCAGDSCISSTSVGATAKAWSISVDHTILVGNLCTVMTVRCKDHPYKLPEADGDSDSRIEEMDLCRKSMLEQVCAQTDCSVELPEGALSQCNRHIDIASCEELQAKALDIVTCTALPPLECVPPWPHPGDPAPHSICEGLARWLIECGHSTGPDGCAFVEALLDRCLAQEFSPEQWQEVAACIDPSCPDGPDGWCRMSTCPEKIACLEQTAPQLLE